MAERLLSTIGRPPGTFPPPTKERSGSCNSADQLWETNAPDVHMELTRAQESLGQPLPAQDLLTILRRSHPKSIPPLQKRDWLQRRSLITHIGDGLWHITLPIL